GDAGSRGDGICGNGDDSGVNGDGGGVVKARSLSISSLGGSDMDSSSRIDILAVIRCTGGTDRPEITLPPRKRLGVNLGPRYEIGEGSSAARPTGGRRADYGF
ncbi:hypothetical protein Tco_0549915, partial [Tanacetum coccineum]